MTRSSSRRARAAQEKARRKLEREPIVLEFAYESGGALQYHGPIVTTGLTITAAHREALEKAGAPIPPPIPCRLLIDTGADTTVVKHEFAERAGLKLINATSPLHGVGIDTTGRTYIGRVLFGVKSKAVEGARHTVFVDTQVMSANLQSEKFDGLIGREVLRHFLLTYDGNSGVVRMRYYRPGSD